MTTKILDAFLIEDVGRVFVVRREDGKMGLPYHERNGIAVYDAARKALEEYANVHSIGEPHHVCEEPVKIAGIDIELHIHRLVGAAVIPLAGARWMPLITFGGIDETFITAQRHFRPVAA